MRTILLAVTMALAATEASAARYYPIMTGDIFVEYLRHEDPMTANDYRKRDKAYSYVDGVRDANLGKAWCDDYTIKTPDLAYDIADEIAKLDKNTRARNAADLIVQHLQRNFPCTKARRR